MKPLRFLSSLLFQCATFLVIALSMVVLFNVVMRYAFNYSNIGVQELEWHMFSLIFLFSMAYTLSVDGHVRVDVLYDKLSPRKKDWINLFGSIALIIPVALIVAYSSIDFVSYSFDLGESSGDPGGLPYRFLIKAAIPISALALALQALLEAIAQARRLLAARAEDAQP